MSRRRPGTNWTANALRAGSFSAAALLGSGFAINLVGEIEIGRIVAMAGVLVLLATPVAGLITTFFEFRGVHPRAAWLALVVLAILAIAAAVAILAG